MKRFLYAVRPTLDILGDTIAILLDREQMWNKFHHWLSIHGTFFIAGWASVRMFKSRTPQPNLIRCLKISCYRPLRPLGFSFFKKVFWKISCLCTFNEEIFVCSAANIGNFGWHNCHPAGQRTGATLGPDLCRKQGRVEEKGTHNK